MRSILSSTMTYFHKSRSEITDIEYAHIYSFPKFFNVNFDVSPTFNASARGFAEFVLFALGSGTAILELLYDFKLRPEINVNKIITGITCSEEHDV